MGFSFSASQRKKHYENVCLSFPYQLWDVWQVWWCWCWCYWWLKPFVLSGKWYALDHLQRCVGILPATFWTFPVSIWADPHLPSLVCVWKRQVLIPDKLITVVLMEQSTCQGSSQWVLILVAVHSLNWNWVGSWKVYIYSLKFVCFGLCCGMDRCSATVRAWLSSKSGVAVPEVPVAGSGRVLNHHSASLKL